MSRAFVKEPDGEQVQAEIPERLQSPHPNYVTPSGLRQLQDQVRQLAERRDELLQAGDEADKKQLQYVTRDLRYYEERLRRAALVDTAKQPDDEVQFGATVEVETPDEKRQTFIIVGEDEADATRGKISWVSPLAQALIDGRAGDVVTWKRPAGNIELEIVRIRKAPG
jgi:transcription elongation factor GreB